MGNLRTLFGRPEVLRAFHGWSTAFWLPFTGLAYALGWLESVTFVSLVSMVALFLGSFSSWQAARVEVKQDEEIDDVQNEHKKYKRQAEDDDVALRHPF